MVVFTGEDRRMSVMRAGFMVFCMAITLMCALPVQADYEAGRRAWDAGKPAEALREWRAAADAGERRAMLALGRLYVQGLGVPQDYVEAHKWFNLAAARGEMAAVKRRDALASRMTPEQVASAQERARTWRPGGGAGRTAATRPRPNKPRAPSPPPPARAVREAQGLLAGLGYEPGTADGRWGARTARAYAGFLRDAGLPPGDMLTPAGLRALRKRSRGRVSGKNAALRAVAAGDASALKAALAAGADPNARGGRGWTPLMHAANKGYKLLVPPLLKAGAKPNLRATDGATALFIAALRGHSEIIAALMKAGADPAIKGPKGRTAQDIARKRYGSIKKAREKGESPAVIALLEGKTWAKVVAEAARLEKLEKLKRMLPAPKAFRDCPECPEMVVVPAGSFMMGSPPGETGRTKHEGPRHRVTIPKPFAVGKYEVTFAEWDACVAAGGCRGHRREDQGWGRGRRPAINVNWDDAKAYVRWLSRKTGKQYRLLSEAEWEYAARAGKSTRYHWGDDIGRNRANCDLCGSRWDDNQTAPVGSFPANAFGLHDAHGNVWEWVEDCWNPNYAGAPADGSAWRSGDCYSRVLRGGSWYDLPRFLRSANRNRSGVRSDDFGFRVARTLDP